MRKSNQQDSNRKMMSDGTEDLASEKEKAKVSINSSMIRLARESRGYTQKQLSKHLEIEQGYLSRLENGEAYPSESLLAVLISTLKYPESFFVEPYDIMGSTMSFNRKRMTLPKSLLDAVRADINIYRLHLRKLLTSVTQDLESRYRIPHLDIEEFQRDPEHIAQLVRAQWQIPAGPIKDITALIERGGGYIIEMDFGTDKIDAELQFDPEVGYIFFVNKNSPADRLRFSLAHELGHAVMHTYPTPDIEDEANRFASEFLAPRTDIKRDFSTNCNLASLANLKRIWKVSMGFLIERAHALGAVTPNQRRYLWQQMASHGYKTREPSFLDFPRETPGTLLKLIILHTKELNYTLSELALFLLLEEKDFLDRYGWIFNDTPRLRAAS